ncbi:hypothetical protein Hanom_Chr01g00032711 [Helianthus anomalus]
MEPDFHFISLSSDTNEVIICSQCKIDWFCYGGVGLNEQSKENGIVAIAAGYKSLERENKLVGFFLVL